MQQRHSGNSLISPSGGHFGLRLLLLIGVFAATITAFWWHFERRMAELQPANGAHALMDSSYILHKEEKKALYAWRDKFEKTWGLKILVHVSADDLTVPSFPTTSLYIGVGLKNNEAVIILPTLTKKALGEGTRLLAEEELAQCSKHSAAGTCLSAVLQTLWDAFDNLL